MAGQLYERDEMPDLNEGVDIEREQYYVVRKTECTAEYLAKIKASLQQASMALDTIRVDLNESLEGTGWARSFNFHKETAAKLNIGDLVTVHTRKGDNGFRDIYAITFGEYVENKSSLKP